MGRHGVRASFLMSLPICLVSSALADVTTWSFGSAHLQYVGGTVGEPEWTEYATPTPLITSASLLEGIRLSGGGPNGAVFTLPGSAFNPGVNPSFGVNRLFLTGTGTVDSNGWLDPEYFITTHVLAAVSLSGGVLDLNLVETSFALFDAGGLPLAGVGSGLPLLPVGAGTHPLDLTAMDVFNEDLPEARLIQWSIGCYFDWTGFAASDTLTVSVPGQSIDIVTSIPAPNATLALAMAIAGASRTRRRRRGGSPANIHG